VSKSAYFELIEQTGSEMRGRHILPINRETIMHPITMEAMDDEKRVNRKNPCIVLLEPGMHLTHLRAGTLLDWFDDKADDMSSSGPNGGCVFPVIPFSKCHAAFPRHKEQLAVFCMLDEDMFFISPSGQTIVIRNSEPLGSLFDNIVGDSAVLSSSVVKLVNSGDVLLNCVGMNHRCHPKHSKEVFPRKVVKQRLIRQERIQSLRQKLP